MSSVYDIQINHLMQISHNFDLFTEERTRSLYKFRCALCGDSKKKANKRRGFFYRDHEIDQLRFKCQNCGQCSGWDFKQYIRAHHPEQFQLYIADVFENTDYNSFSSNHRGSSGKTSAPSNAYIPSKQALPTKNKQEVSNDIKKPKFKPKTGKITENCLAFCTPINSLDDSHPARAYLLGRAFTQEMMALLWYTDNFRDFAVAFEPEVKESALNSPMDRRIIIPFFDKDGVMIAFQGRSLEPKAVLRYVTIKKVDASLKVYGLERCNPDATRIVVEGPLDSLFLPNCLASADSDLLKVEGDVYIPDAQPRNREICKKIKKFIDSGAKVCLLPEKLAGKDINDMVINGMTRRELLMIIAQNSFKGMKAEFEFAEWCKVKLR